MTKSILETVHQTARGLSEAGAMEIATLREFNALCLPLVKGYSAAQIQKIRIGNKASQAVFAACLNTSASTVQKLAAGKEKNQTTHRKSCSASWSTRA